jgi:hypothetical protein
MQKSRHESFTARAALQLMLAMGAMSLPSLKHFPFGVEAPRAKR